MYDDHDLAKLEIIREKYRRYNDNGRPLMEVFTPEENVFILKYIFESLLLEDGIVRSLTDEEVLDFLKELGNYPEDQ